MFPKKLFRGIRRSSDSDDDSIEAPVISENESQKIAQIKNSKNNNSFISIQSLNSLIFLPKRDIDDKTLINENDSSSFLSTINEFFQLDTNIDNKNHKENNCNNNIQTNLLQFSNQEEIEIYHQIQNKNSFVILENQREKISLSIMLINKLFELYNNKLHSKPPKTIFLVCDVTVIADQIKEIELYSKLRVCTLKGKNSKKSKNDYQEFQNVFNNTDIFFAIPDVFYKLLTIGFIKITDISLIIFDNCHYCSANHTYNLIMTDFYYFYLLDLNINRNHLPQILGLTSLTLKENEQNMKWITLQKLIELSENLDSQIIISPKIIENNNAIIYENLNYYLCNNEEELIEIKVHTCDHNFDNLFQILNEFIFKPVIKVCLNEDSLNTNNMDRELIEKKFLQFIKERFYSKNYQTFMKYQVNNQLLLPLLRNVEVLRIFERLQQQLFIIIENLNLYSLFRLFDLYTQIYSQKQNFNFSSKNIIITEIQKDMENLQPIYIKSLYEIFNNCLNHFKMLINNQIDFVSDKLTQLIIKIIEYYNNKNIENNKLIIFVNDYIIAHFIEEPINLILSKINQNPISLSIINTKHSQLENISKNVHNETEQLKTEQSNVLIAISPSEEIIDNLYYGLVIIYNELNSNKHYTQIKEKIKTQNAKFLVFTESKKEIIQKSKELTSIFENLKKIFKNNIVIDLRREDHMKNKRKTDYYYVPNTQAKLSLRNIATVYNEIIQGLTNKKKKVEINKQFEKRTNHNKKIEFKCIGIYTCRELNEEKLNFESEWYNNKVSAENDVFLLFIKYLHRNNMIDDHFKLII